MTETIRIKYTVIMYEQDGSAKSFRTGKRRRVVSKLKHDVYQEAHVVATYQTASGQRIGTNRWTCHPGDALDILEKFTDHELLEVLGLEGGSLEPA